MKTLSRSRRVCAPTNRKKARQAGVATNCLRTSGKPNRGHCKEVNRCEKCSLQFESGPAPGRGEKPLDTLSAWCTKEWTDRFLRRKRRVMGSLVQGENARWLRKPRRTIRKRRSNCRRRAPRSGVLPPRKNKRGAAIPVSAPRFVCTGFRACLPGKSPWSSGLQAGRGSPRTAPQPTLPRRASVHCLLCASLCTPRLSVVCVCLCFQILLNFESLHLEF